MVEKFLGTSRCKIDCGSSRESLCGSFYNLENPEEWSVPIPQKVLDLSGDKFTVYPFNIASVSRKEFVTLENDATGKREIPDKTT